MLRNLRVDPDAKRINNLPEGWETLFLAKTTGFSSFLYAAIIGPRDTRPFTGQQPHHELAYRVKVILFTVENVRVDDVIYGSKYAQGGGFVEVDRSGRGITWTTADECGRNEVFGYRIPPGDVLIAL